MKRSRIFIFMAIIGGLVLGVTLGDFKGQPQKLSTPFQIPEGVYIKLTQEFYEALKAEGNEGFKVYTNDPSREYLRQIAIASRYMVETNLQILRNQETIIKLLSSGKEVRIK